MTSGSRETFFSTMAAGAAALLTHLGVLPASISWALGGVAGVLLIALTSLGHWPGTLAEMRGRLFAKLWPFVRWD